MTRTAVTVAAGLLVAVRTAALASFLVDTVVLERRSTTAVMVVASIALAVASAGIIIAGATILRHRPRHVLGWILFVGSGAAALAELANAYVWFGQLQDPSGIFYGGTYDFPGAAYAGWAYGWLRWLWAGVAVPLMVMLYPDGRLPSRRWRPVFGAVLVISGAGLLVEAMGAAPVKSSVRATPNPFGQRWVDVFRYRLQVFDEQVSILTLLFILVLAVVAAAPLVRLRTGGGPVPIRMFGIAFAVIAGIYLFTTATMLGSVEPVPSAVITSVYAAALVALSVSVVNGVFRHRLAEIEVAVRRAAMFGGLSVFIAVVYGVSALGVGSASSRVGGGWAVPFAASAVVAAGLHPIRARADAWALRLVYGHRPAPPEVISSVASRLTDAPSLADALPQLARSLRDAFGATSATVSVAGDDGLSAAAGEARPSDVTSEVVVRFGDETVGSLRLTRSSREPWTERETELLRLVAAQLAPAVHTLLLDAQLAQRAEEAENQAASLQVSRRRIASAQLMARTRFAEDVHNRVFPLLDAVGDALAFDDVIGARRAADEALAEVRRIGHGLDPSELRDLGPIAALTAEARDRGVTLNLELDNSGGALGRWPEPVERALFLAVVPVIRLAVGSGSPVSLTVRSDESFLRFSVSGPVVLPEPIAAEIEDRLSVTGGDANLRGTGVDAVLPLTELPAAAGGDTTTH